MDGGRLTSTLMLNIFFSPSSFLININPFFSFLPRKITCRRWRRLFQHRGWRTRDETLERGCVNRAFAYGWPVLSTTRRLLKRPMVCHRPFLSRKTGSRLGRPLITDTRQTAIRRDLSLSGYSGRVIIKLTWCTNRHEILFQLSSARRCMYFFQTFRKNKIKQRISFAEKIDIIILSLFFFFFSSSIPKISKSFLQLPVVLKLDSLGKDRIESYLFTAQRYWRATIQLCAIG